MPATETTLSALERNWEMVESAFEEVDEATMSSRPNDESNSMSWLLWHMTIVVDRYIHPRFQGTPTLWIADGWNEKFGMAPDPDDFGMGWSADKVSDWQPPSKEVLLGYFQAATSATRKYLQPLTAVDLDRQIPFPNQPATRSVADALGILVWDNIVHGGQIAYLRGYYRGMGWHR